MPERGQHEDYRNIIRVIITALGLLLQVALFAYLVIYLSELSTVFYAINMATAIAVILHIVSHPIQVNYKLAWIILISIVPIVGGIFYLFYGNPRRRPQVQAQLSAKEDLLARAFEAELADPVPLPEEETAAKQVRFLLESTSYPLWRDTEAVYLPSGETQFAAMLAALESARDFIYMEYFIISEGEMWDAVFAILAAKAAAGVDCRIIYDDIGSMHFLPPNFVRSLTEAGVRVLTYNPLRLALTLRYNNRDHRKILLVDGRIAMTGGTNIADEYINRKLRFGHWKDTGIILQGPAAWNFQVMYLTLWAELSGEAVDLPQARRRSRQALERLAAGERLDLRPFALPHSAAAARPTGGWLLPFDDTPHDADHQAATLYRSMINHAVRTIDIMTPYLVIDDEMVNALITSARSGVRIRIITPHIPDKPYVHAATRSYYPILIEHGIEIYEYTPGFIHAKSLIADRTSAVIGTVNFDYRSLYLHMENAVWLHRCPMIADMTRDFEETVMLSELITYESVRRVSIPVRLARSVLRVISPLL
ncbi:MAG: phospholipase D-like domain-containing protein [Bacillota bacterium]|nr:phospholipase D-like domain-containing protein [Bacillota bacterium]